VAIDVKTGQIVWHYQNTPNDGWDYDGVNEFITYDDGAGNILTVVRGYGSTVKATLANGRRLFILGNAALEGADAASARFTNRVRFDLFHVECLLYAGRARDTGLGDLDLEIVSSTRSAEDQAKAYKRGASSLDGVTVPKPWVELEDPGVPTLNCEYGCRPRRAQCFCLPLPVFHTGVGPARGSPHSQ
jgi:hypothetical protein